MKLIEKFKMEEKLEQQIKDENNLIDIEKLESLIGKTTSLGRLLEPGDKLFYVFCVFREDEKNLTMKTQKLVREEFEYYENNFKYCDYSEDPSPKPNGKFPELYHNDVGF